LVYKLNHIKAEEQKIIEGTASTQKHIPLKVEQAIEA